MTGTQRHVQLEKWVGVVFECDAIIEMRRDTTNLVAHRCEHEHEFMAWSMEHDASERASRNQRNPESEELTEQLCDRDL